MFYNRKFKEIEATLNSLKKDLSAYKWAFNKVPKFKIGNVIWFRNMSFYLEATITDIYPMFSERIGEHTFMYEVKLSCPTHYYRSDCIPEKCLISSKVFQNANKPQKRTTKI